MARLSPDVVYQIKERLWNGVPYENIQAEFGISYQITVGIKGGRNYPEVPWPDGTIGKMAPMRAMQVKSDKRYNTKMARAQVSYSPDGTGKFLEGRELERWELDDPIVLLKLAGKYEEENQKYIKKFGHSIDESFRRFYKVLGRYAHKEEQEKHKATMAAFDEHERRMESDPDYREAYEAERERKAEEAGKLNPPRYNLPNDQCDPEANQKVPWDEVLLLAGDLKVVQIAEQDTENAEPALKPAIQIVFKLLSQRQWKEDHCLRMIYQVKKKIENFWEARQDAA